jgi:hypothetical protein
MGFFEFPLPPRQKTSALQTILRDDAVDKQAGVYPQLTQIVADKNQ